jgi:hypothetical protein
MAFETSILQNGEWTTRTLDVNTVLRHYDLQDQEATANTAEIERAPVLGLLTQTVIRSPLVHWILPVKLRDPETNDVAFIGVRKLLYSRYSFSRKFISPVQVVQLEVCLKFYPEIITDR